MAYSSPFIDKPPEKRSKKEVKVFFLPTYGCIPSDSHGTEWLKEVYMKNTYFSFSRVSYDHFSILICKVPKA